MKYYVFATSFFMLSQTALAGNVETWQKTFDDAMVLAKSAKSPNQLVEKLDPMMQKNFNFEYMTAMAVGKNWKSLTSQEQQQLTPSFQKLLTRIYGKVIYDNRQSTISVTKVEQKSPTSNLIYTTVKGTDKEYHINYTTKLTSNNESIYDVNVEGASLVTVYRNQFNDIYQKEGFTGLLSALQKK